MFSGALKLEKRHILPHSFRVEIKGIMSTEHARKSEKRPTGITNRSFVQLWFTGSWTVVVRSLQAQL